MRIKTETGGRGRLTSQIGRCIAMSAKVKGNERVRRKTKVLYAYDENFSEILRFSKFACYLFQGAGDTTILLLFT